MANHNLQTKAYRRNEIFISCFERMGCKTILCILLFLPGIMLSQTGSLIFSDQGGANVKRSGKSGSGVIEILSSDEVMSPGALTIDDNTQIIYVGDGDKIFTAQGDFGQNQIEIIGSGISTVTGITIDIDNSPGKIYWTEVSGEVKRANLNGSQEETILTTNDLSSPTAITIQTSTSTLYIADGNKIYTCDLEGNNLKELIPSGLTNVRGLAIDEVSGVNKLYWTDSAGTVMRSNMDGSDQETVFDSGLNNPDAIALDFSLSPNWIYIGDGNRILRGFPDGSGLTEIITEELVNITDIVISNYGPCDTISISRQPEDKEVCEGETITFRVSAMGDGPISYQWRKDGNDITGATDSSYTIASVMLNDSGSYDCVLMNPCGSLVSRMAKLTINKNPIPIILPDPAEICQGNSLVLDGSVSGGSEIYVTYLWQGQVEYLNVTNTQQVVFDGRDVGTFQLSYTVIDDKGCMGTDEITVTVHPNPTVTAGEDRSICAGETATLEAVATGGTPGYHYGWSNNVMTAVNPVTPTVTQTFNVIVVDQNTCSDSALVTVVVNPKPQANAGPNLKVCQGESVTLTATATGGTPGYSFSWDGGVSQGASFVPAATSTYTVTVTDMKGCKDVASVTVTVLPNPIVALSGDEEICAEMDARVDLSVSGGTPEYDIKWNDGSGGFSRTETLTETKKYTVMVEDSEGCKGEGEFTVMVNPNPFVTLGDDQEICEDDEITLTAIATDGTEPYREFKWDHGKEGESILEKPTETTIYSITVTDDKGCEGSDQVEITVYPKIELMLSGDEEICKGEEIEISAEATGGTPPFEYMWDDGSTESTRTVMPEETTTYKIKVKDGSNDVCMVEGMIEITVNPVPVVNLGADREICKGDKVTLKADVTEGTKPYKFYSWSPANSGESIEVMPDETTVYSITVTDDKDCEGEDQVKVEVFKPPLVDAGEDKIINEKDTAILVAEVEMETGRPPFTFEWSNGTKNFVNKVSPIPPTTYTVTVTDKLGCTGTDQVKVIVIPDMTVEITGAKEICANKSVRLQALVKGGKPPYSFKWSHGGSLPIEEVSPSKTTLYSVIVTDSEGRANFDQVTIAVNNNPIVSLGEDKTIFEKESITLSPSIFRGNPPITAYKWSTGETQPSITVTPDKTKEYSVAVTDSKGCQGGDKVKVIVIPETGEGIAGPDRKICKGSSTVLGTPSKSNICYYWEPKDGLNDPKIAQPTATPEKTTKYTLTITGEDFSFKSKDEVVVEVVKQVDKISVTPLKCCWKVGDTLKLAEFMIVTSPVGVTGDITISPEILTPGLFSLTDAKKKQTIKFTFDCGDKKVVGETEITVVNEDVSAEYTESRSLVDDETAWKQRLEDKLKFLKGTFKMFDCEPDI